MKTGSQNVLWRGRRGERGATLLIGLIMLVLLTLHALAAYTTSTVQLRIVGNMQDRQDARAAANVAVGQVLSSPAFVAPAGGASGILADIDIDGDGSGDFRVTVTATCTALLPLQPSELDPGIPDDFQCLAGTAFEGGSLCATSHWNLQAVAVPAMGAAATGVAVEVNQGAAVRLGSAQGRMNC
ncbi:MAG: hypothetical protein IPO58_03330 [Betaproteobacteria bacterium]|nr:hypothetical protein [Betaproteobacteria bacterium]